MMKRLLLIAVAIMICLPSADARRRSPKAGKVKDGWYVDSKYDFKMNLPSDNWKVSLGDEDDDTRLVLIQKNYQVPSYYLDAEDYAQVPRLTVFMAESDMGAVAFRDSLVSKTYDSDQKNNILREFEILNRQSLGDMERDELITKSRPTPYINDLRAAEWFGDVGYTKNVTLSVSSQGAKRVRGRLSGAVVVVKNGNKMLLFHAISEDNAFEAVWNELQPVVESLEWSAENKKE